MSEGLAVETPTVEAPPPPSAPAEASAPPAVETPTDTTGTWLMEMALKDGEGQVTPAEKTPLPAEAPAESKASEPTAPAAEAKAAPPLEAPPANAASTDEELTPEEDALVKSRPEAEQPELGRRLKTARFMSFYLDPAKPTEEVRAHLEQRSPSRYAELEHSVIQHKLANIPAFADEAFLRYPELYGRLALEIFNGDPEFFIKKMTGKDIDVATLKAAADAYDPANPPKPAAHAGNGAGAGPLTPSDMEDVRLYLGDEIASKIEGLNNAAPVAAPDSKELETLRTENAQLKAAKPDPEQLQQAETAKDQAFGKGVKVIEDYVVNFADDAKAGLGLKVSEEERRLAPEVADLKDTKRDVWINGKGDLPAFEKGFAQWGKEYPEFNQLLGRVWHFADKNEEANVIAAAQALLPYTERYVKERIKHPIFARLDNAIKILAAQTNPKVPNDAIVPGAPANSQPQASAPERRIASFLLDDALSVK